ncbi:MAG: NAD(P)-binding domain-containing protein [Chloroflexaceae bacterium]|nr:NAD(P)-binding domain-containing protein [Chloroflexaceae bacterium]
MQVGMIGLGNIGSAMANLIANNGYPVLGWEYHADVVEQIHQQHTNERFLPGIALSPHLCATTSLEQVVTNCDVLFVGIPSLYIGKTLQPVQSVLPTDTILVNLAKGIDRDRGLTAFQTLSRLFPQHRCMMLAGAGDCQRVYSRYAHRGCSCGRKHD